MNELTDVTPSAVYVGSIVQGARLALAHGRDLGMMDDVENDNLKKVRCVSLSIFIIMVNSNKLLKKF